MKTFNLLVSLVLFSLVACNSGGGSGSNPPPAAAPTKAPDTPVPQDNPTPEPVVPPTVVEEPKPVPQNAALSQGEIKNLVKMQTGLPDLDVDRVVGAIYANDPQLQLYAYMHTSGFNAALCIDSDTWSPVVTFKDSKTGEFVSIPNFYNIDFENGGLKVEFCYKWVLVFISSHEDINTLDGAIFGRGIGANFPITPSGIAPVSLAHVEIAVLPGQNRNGSIYVLSPKIGFATAQLNFPKMTFRRLLYRDPGTL